jgi:hypothetical protein
MFKPRRVILVSATLGACLLLQACGGSRARRSSASTQSIAPQTSAIKAAQASQSRQESALRPLNGVPQDTVLARVGSTAITAGAVEHLMTLKAPAAPLPDPPSYAGCVANTKAAAAAKSVASAAEQSEEQLKKSCQQTYRQLLYGALSSAIHNQWLIGEAAEESIEITPREVRQEFEQAKRAFLTKAEFETYRKSVKQTIPGMLYDVKLNKLSQAIYQSIARKEHPPSSGEVAAYYSSHRSRYTIPEGRAVRILRTINQLTAQKAKRELQSGKSFAEVLKVLVGIAQPPAAKNGEIADLTPTLFVQKSLNEAIFSAKLHALSGPVNVTARHKTIAKEANSGSYVFEVTRIVPARQIPLSQVKAAIAKQLSEQRKLQAAASFIAAFRARWRARTDCQAGWVVSYCRQYKAKGGGAADPYTL